MIVDLQKTATYAYAVWKTDETSEELLAMLSHKTWYLPFLEKVAKEGRRREWLACRVLLKQLLACETQVYYKESGAPFIAEEGVHISFSHTKGYVAVQVSTAEQPAGIDIEYLSDRVKKIQNRFVSPDEAQHISSENEANHLLLHWCAKETLFKLLDTEAVDFCKHLHLAPFDYALCGSIQAYETHSTHGKSFTLGYKMTEAYAMTFCTAYASSVDLAP